MTKFGKTRYIARDPKNMYIIGIEKPKVTRCEHYKKNGALGMCILQ